MPSRSRRWSVASGILEFDGTVLMVNNLRRSGRTDWTTPGGVVDRGETAVKALTREVAEETGLRVASWDGPMYTVEADGRDGPGWFLRVEVHRARRWSGELDVADPDGIVFDARWVRVGEIEALLEGQHSYMAEPLLAYLDGDAPRGHVFRYTVSGDRRSGWVIAPATQ
ncbi:NUDIX hydrolase [Candidatus Poriferisodalis sp.]|uniref:NUDIX hydrolase n=1 Tax=Candidatus Poriferisodalis sp. TaxID=3101277 RepID=UPI003B02677A